MDARPKASRRFGMYALVGGLVLLALIVSAGIVVIRALGGHEVGPDADEMAKDPLLHLDLGDAEAEEILARTGREGGVMPAMANPTSSASRRWHIPGGDRTEEAIGVVETADDLGMSFWRIRCTRNTVIYHGAKAVDLGHETEVMYADIHVERDPSDGGVEIWVDLESSESALDADDPPNPSLGAVDENCPTELVEQFESVRDG